MNEVTVVKEENVIKLNKPINGFEELVFDEEKITGKVLLECERKARVEDKSMLIPNLSLTYQAMVGAKATGLRYDDVLTMNGIDFTTLTNKVLRFLNGSE